MSLRNYSERTISNYVSHLIRLSNYYSLPPDQLTREQVKEYAHYLLKDKKVSFSTINQIISAWKILKVDVLGQSWHNFKIKRPKCEKRLPQVLSQQEAIALVHSPNNFKHRTLLMLAYSTGLRRSELLNLKPSDIDSPRKVLRVLRGKGHKTREIPITDMLIDQLRNYYKRYQPSVYLFEGVVPGRPYSATSFCNVLKSAACKVGIKKNISPHVLRHCYASHMLERGVNLKRVQLYLGHNSLKTTSVYLHLSNSSDSAIPNLLDLPNE